MCNISAQMFRSFGKIANKTDKQTNEALRKLERVKGRWSAREKERKREKLRLTKNKKSGPPLA